MLKKRIKNATSISKRETPTLFGAWWLRLRTKKGIQIMEKERRSKKWLKGSSVLSFSYLIKNDYIPSLSSPTIFTLYVCWTMNSIVTLCIIDYLLKGMRKVHGVFVCRCVIRIRNKESEYEDTRSTRPLDNLQEKDALNSIL